MCIEILCVRKKEKWKKKEFDVCQEKCRERKEKKTPNLFLLSFSSFLTFCASSRPWQKKQMMFKRNKTFRSTSSRRGTKKNKNKSTRRSSWLIIHGRSSSNGSDLLQRDLLGAVFFFVFRLLESHHLSLSHSFFHFPCLSLSCSEAAAAPLPSPSPEFFVPQFPLLRAALSSRVHRQVVEGEL